MTWTCRIASARFHQPWKFTGSEIQVTPSGHWGLVGGFTSTDTPRPRYFISGLGPVFVGGARLCLIDCGQGKNYMQLI